MQACHYKWNNDKCCQHSSSDVLSQQSSRGDAEFLSNLTQGHVHCLFYFLLVFISQKICQCFKYMNFNTFFIMSFEVSIQMHAQLVL